MATANSPFPRWKQLIAQGIKDGMADKQKGILYYALSTVETGIGDGKPAAPHVRMVVHRGFVNEQRSKESDTGLEPCDDNFGSNACMLTTTDIRSPKAQDILKQQGAARGEICWWMESKSLQFRVAGTLHLLPTAQHPAAKSFNGARLAPPPNASSRTPPKSEFDWAQERRRIFEKLSPELLASFTRPTPGGPHPNQDKLKPGSVQGPGEGDEKDAKTDTESPWKLELPQPGKEENDDQKMLLAESEKNFALLVMSPESIDIVDLARDRRSIFRLSDSSKGPNSEWTEERLVP